MEAVATKLELEAKVKELEKENANLLKDLGKGIERIVVLNGKAYAVWGEPCTVKALGEKFGKRFVEEDRVIVCLDTFHGV